MYLTNTTNRLIAQRRISYQHIAHLLLGLLLLGLLGACGDDTASAPTDTSTAPPAGADAPASEATLQVSLLPPDQQEGGTLAVRVQRGDGTPITDASVRLEGDMNHAGMIPVISAPTSHTVDGIYRVPFEFSMLGDWIISVFVTTADGHEYQEQIEIGVRQEGLDIP
ncbi:MAG: FixH family protein [Litorilinea sp.]